MPTDDFLGSVLVVDDEDDVRELLAEYLRDRGLDVAEAADGRAAVTAIEREPDRYDLIIVDLNLPSVDGLGVLQAARAANALAYVVIITGYATLDSAIQAVRLGAYDYLTKPFSIGQIEVVLRRVEDRRVLERENRQLTRQLNNRTSVSTGVPGDDELARLARIEERLERIEKMLGPVADYCRPVPGAVLCFERPQK